MANKKIILLEDDRILSDAYKLMLENDGYQVFCFENSKNILEKINSCNPALVITDLVMPDHDGAEGIFKILIKYTLPIIVISAYPEFIKLIESEVAVTLVKPIKPDELLECVREQVGLSA